MNSLTVHSIKSLDIDEFLEQMRAKFKRDFEINLLSNQSFSGEVKGVFHPEFSMAVSRFNGHLENFGKVPKEFMEFQFPLNDNQLVVWDLNNTLSSRGFALIPPEKDFEWLIKGSIQIMTVQMYRPLFENQFQKLPNHPTWPFPNQSAIQILNKENSRCLKKQLLALCNSVQAKAAKINLAASPEEVFEKFVEIVGALSFHKRIVLEPPSGAELIQKFRVFLRENDFRKCRIGVFCLQEQISNRTLEYACRNILGTSPKKYMKAYYLNRARQELAKRSGTIQSTADQIGFWHMGQFSKDFKNLFGQLPSVKKSKF